MDDKELIANLRSQVFALREEVAGLKAKLDGDRDEAFSRLMTSKDRQREALDRLHTRVVNQRFHLRTLNELGRGLTKEEYLEARDAVQNEQVKDRLVGVIV